MLRDLKKIAFKPAILRATYFYNVLRCENKGFASIVEVIITSVIFVIVSAGIMSTVAQFRPQGQESSQKMEAAYIGKGVIDDLRRQVSAEDWFSGGGPLAVGGPTVIADYPPYTVTYVITEPIPDVRHLTMNITWPNL